MPIDRTAAMKAFRACLTDELVIGGIGLASYDLFLAGDRPENFYTWGAMGTPASIGLGLALAAPAKRVIVLDGDGSILMNLGTLCTIASKAPANLVHVVWNNHAYGITGGQQTALSDRRTDIAALGAAAGIAKSVRVQSMGEWEDLLPRLLQEPGPWLVDVDCEPTAKRKNPRQALQDRYLQKDPFIASAKTGQRWLTDAAGHGK